MVAFVRAKESVFQHISDYTIMDAVVRGAYVSLYYLYAKIKGLCCLSPSKTGFSFFLCTITACHMPILCRRSDGKESNCVHFLEENTAYMGKWNLQEWVGGAT